MGSSHGIFTASQSSLSATLSLTEEAHVPEPQSDSVRRNSLRSQNSLLSLVSAASILGNEATNETQSALEAASKRSRVSTIPPLADMQSFIHAEHAGTLHTSAVGMLSQETEDSLCESLSQLSDG